MQIEKPIIVIMLDQRRAKKTGLYPVKLRITFNRQQQYYRTGIDTTIEDFDMIRNASKIDQHPLMAKRRSLKTIKIKLDTIIVKASEAIAKLSEFSFNSFELLMYSKPLEKKDFYGTYKTVIDKLNLAGNLGTASNYSCSYNSLKKYKSKLNFDDVTIDFLKGYEKWLLVEGKSITTVGIYLRPLRAILNIAIEENLFSREHYPFGKRRYQIPAGRNVKKALTQYEIGKIYNYQTPCDSWLQWAKDMWLFSYFANGINMKDIALLEHSNIDEEFIRLTRAKCRNTSKANIKIISIYITDELKSIIEKWCNDKSQKYLFPVLQDGQNLNRQRSLITQFTKMVNKHIKDIAKTVGVEKPVTTYTARHSFATVLKRHGVSTEAISECLGHHSTKTTISYLDSFDDGSKREISKLLNHF